MTKRILIVTKNDTLYAELANAFAEQDWLTYRVTTAVKVIEKLKHHNFNSILWDLSIANIDTAEATISLIREQVKGPIIAIDTKYQVKSYEKLLENHFDDYLVQPISMVLLTNLLKQRWWYSDQIFHNSKEIKKDHEKNIVTQKDLIINRSKHEVKIRGQEVYFTPKEFKLLEFLLNHQGQVLSREQLLQNVWGYDYIGTSRMVDIHISHLRDKLETDPQHPTVLKTVRGFGYIFQL